MKSLRKLVFVIGITLSVAIVGQVAHSSSAFAATFTAGHIIDNNIFTNSNALTQAQIQQFLNDMVGTCDTNGTGTISYYYNSSTGKVGSGSSGGATGPSVNTSRAVYGQRYDSFFNTNVAAAPYVCINQYLENPSNQQNNLQNPNATIAGGQSAAQIIYNAAQTYQINPEVLLTTLQKEQGLVTDDWPWVSEYQSAMGYACPDSGGCSTNYSDFYEQVDGAAWQFRYYLNNPGAFNYWIGPNTIDYAPGCGGSTVNIQNAATAALYIYTPYQPDSNVLAYTNAIGSTSGPGPAIGDSCAAYGNRNFWWYFNSWFGPSVDTSVYLGEESGSNTVYVVYDGQKQGIPSEDVLESWGLSGIPVTTLDPSVFNAIPTASTVLTRFALNTSTGQDFFADNGNTYSVSANDLAMWNNFPGQTQSQVSSTLIDFSNDQGEIKPYVSEAGNSTFYAMDNGELHPITSGAVYNLWAGDNNPPITLSSAYFNTLTISSSLIDSPEFTYGGTTYLLSDNNRFTLSSAMAALMPTSWSGLTIGNALAASFTAEGPLHYMINAPNSPAVYLLDTNATLRGIPDLNTDGMFQTDASGDTSGVSSDLINYMTVGTPVLSNILSVGGSYYVMDNGLQPIPTDLTAAYDPSSYAITLNSAYSSIFPITSDATNVVKIAASPAIYYIDSGDLLPFSNPTTASLVSGSEPITFLTVGALNEFGHGPIMENYITNGTTNYLLDGGTAYSVPNSNIASAWNLGQPLTVTSAATSSFTSGGALQQAVQVPSGQYCLIDNQAYCTSQTALASIWNISSATLKPSMNLLNSLGLNYSSLSAFASPRAGQPGYGTIYTISGGHLIGIPSMNAAFNLGIGGQPIVNLDSYTISTLSTSSVWEGYLAQDSGGTDWILDNGVKRPIPSQYLSAWTTGQTPTVLGTTYLSLLPTGSAVSDTVNTPGNPTVYGIINGERYGFTSLQALTSSGLAGSVSISSSLLPLIPSGGIWSQ